MEVVQAEEAAGDIGQGFGYGGFGGVGEVRLAVNYVLMDAGVESAFSLLGRAAEGDPVAAARLMADGEPCRLEPRGDFGQIAITESEAISEGFRCEPLMEGGRGWVLLIAEELVQAGLLGGGRFNQEHHVVHGGLGG